MCYKKSRVHATERAMKKGSTTWPGQALFLLTAVVAATVGQSTLATEVYTWTDEDGVVHFSDTRPAATDTKTIQLETAPGSVSYSDPVSEAGEPMSAVEGEMPLTAAQQRRQEIAARSQARREQQAETEIMCERHRKRLEQMEPARRVYYTDENGQEVRMDDVQRVTLIEESRNYVAENCQ
jgi:hypothetical protein